MSANASRIQTAKIDLFKLLLVSCVSTVEVEFVGSGDEGQIGSVEFTDSAGERVDIENITIYFDEEPCTPSEYVENLCWLVLEETGMDWINNEGGQGTIIFSTLGDSIEVNMDINFLSTDKYSFEY